MKAILRAIALLPLAGIPVLIPASAEPSPDLGSAQAAATWAATQLTDSNHVEGDFGPDAGLTADLVLALVAAHVDAASAQAAADWLAEQAPEYVSAGIPKSVSAGSAAKLILVARATGADPADFGGVNLPRVLTGQLTSSGQFVDRLEFGGPDPVDQSTVFTQSLAVMALASSSTSPEVDFLVDSACPDGGFPVFYPAAGAACESDADGTGIAVQALFAADRAAAAQPAVDWLIAQQAESGAFMSSGPGASENTNTTALAVQGLRAAGQDRAADAGQAWLRSRQLGCTAKPGERGAIGYLDPIADGSALRATAQAIPALAGVSLAQILPGAGPQGQAPSCLPSPTQSAKPTQTATPSSTVTVAPTATPKATTTPKATDRASTTARPTVKARPVVPQLPVVGSQADGSSLNRLSRPPVLPPLVRPPVTVPTLAAGPQVPKAAPTADSTVAPEPPLAARGNAPTVTGPSESAANASPWLRISTPWGIGVGVFTVALWVALVLWQRRSP